MMVSISCYVINEFQQRVLLRGAKTKSNTGWQDDAGANHHVDSREPSSSGSLCEWFFSLGSQKGSFIPVPPSVPLFFSFSNCSALIWWRIYRKSLNPSLSWLIVAVPVCLSTWERTWEGAKCLEMQLSTSGQEKAEAPARLTDTMLACDAYTSRARKQQRP